MFFAIKHSGGWFLQGQAASRHIIETLPWETGQSLGDRWLRLHIYALSFHDNTMVTTLLYVQTKMSTFSWLCKQLYYTAAMFKTIRSTKALRYCLIKCYKGRRFWFSAWTYLTTALSDAFSLVSDFSSIPSSLVGLSFILSPLLFHLNQIMWWSYSTWSVLVTNTYLEFNTWWSLLSLLISWQSIPSRGFHFHWLNHLSQEEWQCGRVQTELDWHLSLPILHTP